jgi:hypothetical protein
MRQVPGGDEDKDCAEQAQHHISNHMSNRGAWARLYNNFTQFLRKL